MPWAGRLATLSSGLAQGACCRGSSWPLLVVLLLLGMMNLAWMGVIALLILLEKALPSGQATRNAVGIVLIAVGMVLIGVPHALAALMSYSGESQLELILQ